MKINVVVGGAKLPVMATSGGSGHVAGTTALPLRADLRAATSAFLAWRSALPRTADAVGRGLPRPVMTLSGHSVEYAVQQVGTENQGLPYILIAVGNVSQRLIFKIFPINDITSFPQISVPIFQVANAE